MNFKGEIFAEYGGNIRFLPPECIKFYINDEEVITPKCEKCGSYKQFVIGSEACAHVCQYCPASKDEERTCE